MIRYAFPATLITDPVSAQTQGYGHMMNWGYGMGMMFGPVLWLVVLGLVVAGVIWVVRRFDNSHTGPSNSDALSVLDMRFASGEIDAEEYAARKKLLMGG
jgi:putative membrane protein